MPYVYSTLTHSQAYVDYEPMPEVAGQLGRLPVERHRVTIEGGHGIPIRKTLVTPYGVMTPVSDDELEFLLAHPIFKLHVENGNVTYSKTKEDKDTVAASMKQKDNAAQKTPEDFERKGVDAPVVATPSKLAPYSGKRK